MPKSAGAINFRKVDRSNERDDERDKSKPEPSMWESIEGLLTPCQIENRNWGNWDKGIDRDDKEDEGKKLKERIVKSESLPISVYVHSICISTEENKWLEKNEEISVQK